MKTTTHLDDDELMGIHFGVDDVGNYFEESEKILRMKKRVRMKLKNTRRVYEYKVWSLKKKKNPCGLSLQLHNFSTLENGFSWI